jgi:hypothetical protein
MGVVVAVPEISAAVGGSNFPFHTISGTTGHLEDLDSIVAIIPVAIIAMMAIAVFRLPSEAPDRVVTFANDPNPIRGAPSGAFAPPKSWRCHGAASVA